MNKTTRVKVTRLLQHVEQDLVNQQENLQKYGHVQSMIDLAITTLRIDQERIREIGALLGLELEEQE